VASMSRMRAAPRAVSGVLGSASSSCSGGNAQPPSPTRYRPCTAAFGHASKPQRPSGMSGGVPLSTWTPCRDAIRIAPSLLAADFGRLADAAQALEGSGAERLHVDVMDGLFVPNFTFGVDTVRS